MLVVDRSQTVCGVCNRPADWGEERHISIMGDRPTSTTGGAGSSGRTTRCAHGSSRSAGFVGRDGEMRKVASVRCCDFPVLAWLDP